MLELYFDFSGYCDMARGLGKMFGFRLPQNFDSPLMATSVKDFWRRWHISLSSWLKDYLYISLGGNRKGRLRTYVNLMIEKGYLIHSKGNCFDFYEIPETDDRRKLLKKHKKNDYIIVV